MQSSVTANRSNSPWRNPWVLGWIGLIVVVLGVNLTMVYLAVSTNPGLVSEDFYNRGQHYEQTLVSRLAKDPGWTMRTDFPDDLRPGEPATIRVVLVDKVGQPVTPDDLAAIFPMNIIEQEASSQRWIDIPDEVLQKYLIWRPSPLYRAYNFEKLLNCPVKIYYKNEFFPQ